jgi:glycine cleavage system H protein
MKILPNLKYTKSDEWVSVDGNVATLGITDFAQDQLSDIVFLEITVDVDDDVSAGSSYGTIESVKAAADVNSPLSGKVLEINEALADAPETINSSPFEAWMIKVEMADSTELNVLLDAAAYQKQCEENSH